MSQAQADCRGKSDVSTEQHTVPKKNNLRFDCAQYVSPEESADCARDRILVDGEDET